MRLFRQRPLTVEAMQYDGTNDDEIATFMGWPGCIIVRDKLEPGDWAVSDAFAKVLLSNAELTARFEPVTHV